MKKLLIITTLLVSLSPFASQANNLSNVPSQITDGIFTKAGLTDANFEKVSEDFATGFSHTTNSGAKNLGKLFGVEAGILVGVFESNNLRKIAEQQTGDDYSELKHLPIAGIVAGVALPFGFGAELNFLPKISVEDGSLSNTSIAARWNITDVIPIVGTFSPLKLSTRIAYGMGSLDYDFEIDNSEESIDFDIRSFEVGVLAGASIPFIEPYLGLSYTVTTTDVNADVSAVVSGVTYTGDASFDAKVSGVKTTAGLIFKIPFIRLGLEYANLHGNSKYTAKLAAKF